jgi:hypothetical protein
MVSVGLAKKEARDLILHMTLMNAKYVVSTSNIHNQSSAKINNFKLNSSTDLTTHKKFA